MDKIPNKYHIILIYVVLVLATITAFEPVRHNQFVDYDDDEYITENQNVTGGLTRESVIWAFTKPHYYMWHPLTSLSHILDYELFGPKPLGHHLVSLLIHIANTLLLFWLLKRMTGAIWRSAFVAAVFALHPLTVESVAWAAERKNILSSFFWMLTIAAYIRYAERPAIGRYLLVVLSLCLGLMAKPMVVTLPFVLLLLDYWPLGRFQWGRESRENVLAQLESVKINYQNSSAWRLVVEKIPLFILVVVVSAITFIAQRGTMSSIENLPLNLRISNALVSYISYIGKMIYPTRLAVLYPHPTNSLPLWQPIACFVILAGVTAVAIYMLKRRGYLAVGWLWYLGTLVPVIGFVQVGVQGMADRYTYLPSIGILIIVAWGADEFLTKWRYRKTGLAIAAAAVLAVLPICTRIQTRYWRNSLALYGRALAVTKNNHIMHDNYGFTLQEAGKIDEAVSHYHRAIQIKPNYAKVHDHLGVLLASRGELNEAVNHFRYALRFKPDSVDAHINMGNALASQGRFNEAISHFRHALQLKPNFADIHYNLAMALRLQGRGDEAINHSRQALRFKPDFVEAHINLGLTLATQGRLDEAISHFRQALKIQPDLADAHYNLAIALRLQGRDDEAIEHYRRTISLKPDYAGAYHNLGSILASQGRLDEAIEYFRQAIRFAPDSAAAHYNLGNALEHKGEISNAIGHYRRLLDLKPNWPAPLAKLAWLRATHPNPKLRNANQAVNLAERAAELTKYQDASILDTLAAAYAAAGRFDQAVTTAQKAIDIAHTAQADELADNIRKRLQLYEQAKPYRESPPKQLIAPDNN